MQTSSESRNSRPPSAAELRAIAEAARLGNMAVAMRLAAEAAATGVEHPVVLTFAVHEALLRGALEAALAYAIRARAIAPRDSEVLNAYGLALMDNGRAMEAIAAFDAGLRAAPASPGLHYNKGCAYEALNDNARAMMCFERAIGIDATHVQALTRLSFIAAILGDAEKAREMAARALRLAPGHPTATLALAQADIESKNFEDALSRVASLLSTPPKLDRAIAEGLAADALDSLGRRDEAFRAYSASNATRRGLVSRRYESGERAFDWTRRLGAYFRARSSWPSAFAQPSERAHVFLVGFPRSGTTLLEQVLAAHPAVRSMEERDCLVDSILEFEGTAEDLDRFSALSDDELQRWREAYWSRAGEWGVDADVPVFVDKLPLNTVHLGLIARLFPDAKVLFALRDPADVVWSCFRRRFSLSPAMYELLTLEGAARYYDAVMALAQEYRRLLPLAVHELHYEAMVGDFEGETRRLCAFVGLEWQNDFADFATKTRGRAIATPSAAQVARGLFTTGIGQWRAYEKHLAPILPVLAPWRARFGYA